MIPRNNLSYNGPFIQQLRDIDDFNKCRYYIYRLKCPIKTPNLHGQYEYLHISDKTFQRYCGRENMFDSYGSARNFFIKCWGIDPGPKHIGLTHFTELRQKVLDTDFNSPIQ